MQEFCWFIERKVQKDHKWFMQITRTQVIHCDSDWLGYKAQKKVCILKTIENFLAFFFRSQRLWRRENFRVEFAKTFAFVLLPGRTISSSPKGMLEKHNGERMAFPLCKTKVLTVKIPLKSRRLLSSIPRADLLKSQTYCIVLDFYDAGKNS